MFYWGEIDVFEEKYVKIVPKVFILLRKNYIMKKTTLPLGYGLVFDRAATICTKRRDFVLK